ncbi:hypothetical protein [Salipiger marinus]|uniref:hypothetical protein n=1 Tax=Salipiger marinus TaxID=555512 RepID=UPI00405847CD
MVAQINVQNRRIGLWRKPQTFFKRGGRAQNTGTRPTYESSDIQSLQIVVFDDEDTSGQGGHHDPSRLPDPAPQGGQVSGGTHLMWSNAFLGVWFPKNALK